MGKKTKSLPLIYLLGMAITAIGFFIPMFKVLGKSLAGYDFINFEKGGFVTIGALLIVIGAIAGVLFCFLGLKNSKLLRLVALIVSIVGGVVLVIGFTDNVVYKWIAKGLLKNAYVGCYMVVAGWLVGLCGVITNK